MHPIGRPSKILLHLALPTHIFENQLLIPFRAGAGCAVTALATLAVVVNPTPKALTENRTKVLVLILFFIVLLFKFILVKNEKIFNNIVTCFILISNYL